jgi:hypothetical protein
MQSTEVPVKVVAFAPDREEREPAFVGGVFRAIILDGQGDVTIAEVVFHRLPLVAHHRVSLKLPLESI